MAFEIPIDVDYFDHPKTMMLIGLIGPLADVFPLRLWRWCARYAKDGVVKGGRAQIESAVKWEGEVGVLHKALIKCGFLEKDGKTVHDYMEHIGRAIYLYEQKKLRQKNKYAADVKGILPEESGRIPPILSYPILSHPIPSDSIPSDPPLTPPSGGNGDFLDKGKKRRRRRRDEPQTVSEIADVLRQRREAENDAAGI